MDRVFKNLRIVSLNYFFIEVPSCWASTAEDRVTHPVYRLPRAMSRAKPPGSTSVVILSADLPRAYPNAAGRGT